MKIKVRVRRRGNQWVKWSEEPGRDLEFCKFEEAFIFDTLIYDVGGFLVTLLFSYEQFPGEFSEIFGTRVTRYGGVDHRSKYEMLLYSREHKGIQNYRIPEKKLVR